MELKGTVAVVTGGGTGIGRAVAESLARRGAAAIVINYSRSRAEAKQTAAALIALGTQGIAFRADVSRDTEVRHMVSETIARFGRLDVLVNNAGATRHIPLADLDGLTADVWREVLSTNLMGTFYCSRACGPELRKARGAIVNVASVAGYRASGSSIAYGVSKAAVLQLTRGLAIALAPEVRVNAIAPGAVATRWFRQVDPVRAAEVERATAAATPLHDIAMPIHCAQAVIGLLESDFVTGEVITVDGGKHLLY